MRRSSVSRAQAPWIELGSLEPQHVSTKAYTTGRPGNLTAVDRSLSLADGANSALREGQLL